MEHYRESTKEQRQQNLRRYDYQIQLLQSKIRQLQQTIIVKQDELNELSLINTKISIALSIPNVNQEK
ncbi:hypothetical protein [Acinetobacter sp. Leaf130]|uniref:hypothetical protein n=1 Tax=Acinetobacter sp. Leaf130 TaxID=1736269 RepID=UPI00191BF4DF|nr:hypothetical protein [Acinetobacter sp. Leaf130]